MIELYHVEKEYQAGRAVLVDITLRIDKGEFVFITGPSGAGKTTLFKLLFREELPTRGHILVDDRNITAMSDAEVPFLRRKLGLVFQDFRLLERKTVVENVAIPLEVTGVDRRSRTTRALRVLRQVGLEHRLHDWPSRLSGGEQQRVAIARALVVDPLVILADEPTGNLDPELAREIMGLFFQANVRGTTVVVATHDRELIARTRRRVLTIDAGHVLDERLAFMPELT